MTYWSPVGSQAPEYTTATAEFFRRAKQNPTPDGIGSAFVDAQVVDARARINDWKALLGYPVTNGPVGDTTAFIHDAKQQGAWSAIGNTLVGEFHALTDLGKSIFKNNPEPPAPNRPKIYA